MTYHVSSGTLNLTHYYYFCQAYADLDQPGNIKVGTKYGKN